MKIEEFKIANLKCGGCETTIKKGLLKIEGVSSVKIDNDKDTVTVTYDDSLDKVKITNKLHSLGYPEATEENGLLMKDGTVEEADLIVLATGYQSQESVVREMLGDKAADRVGQIWGIAPNGEIASMFVATPQAGLWFTGGGFAHCRIYSHFIAMGIKVRELGLIS